ncbi:MAG: hypothetical protein MJA31_14720 [Clostridia bacterium]|nr:hypothetical protein [Clostridia bacterium]
MGKEKYTFDDFMINVGGSNFNFYNEINKMLTENGFIQKVELKKTGYSLSYVQKSTKKTLLNFVNRKKGTFIRIYGNHTDKYMEKFTTLPISMIKEINKAQDCKRMIDADACNSKCKMGVNLLIDGEIYGKCRYSALFFLIETEKYEAIKGLVESEMKECFDF